MQKKLSGNPLRERFNLAGVAGFEPTHTGARNQCLTAWRHPNVIWWGEQDSNLRSRRQQIYSLPPLAARESPHNTIGAGDGTRTRNLLITNQLLCQLSYTSQQVWCLRVDLNHRHRDFQSLALPAELPRQKNGDPEGARTPDLQRDRLAY